MGVSVAFLDDDAFTRTVADEMLSPVCSRLDLLGANSEEEHDFVSRCVSASPRVAIVDNSLQSTNGCAVARRLSEAGFGGLVVVTSASSVQDVPEGALFVPKHRLFQADFIDFLKAVGNGRAPQTRESLERRLESMNELVLLLSDRLSRLEHARDACQECSRDKSPQPVL